MIKEFKNKDYDFSGKYNVDTAKQLGIKIVEHCIVNGFILEPESIVQGDVFYTDFISDFAELIEEVLEIEYYFD